jgi:hypothetical protein
MGDRPVRILFVDINTRYINPGVELVTRLFCTLPGSDVVFYGLGYTESAIIAQGVDRFLEDKKFAPDLVVLGQGFPWQEASSNSKFIHLTDYNYCYFDSTIDKLRATVPAFTSDVKAFLKSCRLPTIILQFNFDYYGASQRTVAKVLEYSNFYLITRGDQFVLPLEQVVGKNEKHYQRKRQILSDDWLNFLKANQDRVISLVHFAAPHEFFPHPLSERKYDVVVPGIGYELRQAAKKVLRGSDLKIAPQFYMKVFSLLNKAKTRPYASLIGLDAYNALYRNSIIQSKIAYVAREAFGLPVRKFFEVPAMGAAMVGVLCNAHHELGFQDKVNYFHCPPDGVVEVAEHLLKNPDWMQKVASAGQKLIQTKHSFAARQRQIADCLNAIHNKTFFGSYWSDGDFFIRKRVDNANP